MHKFLQWILITRLLSLQCRHLPWRKQVKQVKLPNSGREQKIIPMVVLLQMVRSAQELQQNSIGVQHFTNHSVGKASIPWLIQSSLSCISLSFLFSIYSIWRMLSPLFGYPVGDHLHINTAVSYCGNERSRSEIDLSKYILKHIEVSSFHNRKSVSFIHWSIKLIKKCC